MMRLWASRGPILSGWKRLFCMRILYRIFPPSQAGFFPVTVANQIDTSGEMRKTGVESSYEHIIVDVLSIFQKEQPTPYILQFLHQLDQFNKVEVEARKYETAQHVLDEYQDAQIEATSLLMQIPDEKVQERGTMPWYGEDCCLADFINRIYDHTREHCAQIARFRQRL